MARCARVVGSSLLFAIAAIACGGAQRTDPAPHTCEAPAVAPTPPAAPDAVPKHGDSKVITVIVRWKVKPEFEKEALAYTKDFIAKAQASEPGTLLYTFSKDPKQERTYVWVERYRDQAAYQAHQDTPYRKEALPLVKKWLEVWPPDIYLKLDQTFPE
jgi:quinol monooxygenase YgiN